MRRLVISDGLSLSSPASRSESALSLALNGRLRLVAVRCIAFLSYSVFQLLLKGGLGLGEGSVIRQLMGVTLISRL